MWKEIIINGFPSGYYISETGVVINKNKKILKFQLDKRGYQCIYLKGKKI